MTEAVYRVFTESSTRENAWVEVGPDGDGVGCVEVRTTGKPSEEYFGVLRLTIPPEMARELAKALIRAADDIEANR